MTTPPPSDPAADAERVLADWLAREAEVRQRLTHFGVGRPEQFVGRTGMAVFEAMLAGEIPAPPICQTLDFVLMEATPGQVVFQGRPQASHYNPLGTVHGGWTATLLDSAVACAVHTLLPVGRSYTTLELKVNYVRALTDRVPRVRAIGRSIHQGGRVATADGRLVDAHGTLYAHASTTCLVMEVR